MPPESKMLLKKKEGAVGRKTTSNGLFLPVNYLTTRLPDQLWNPNHTVLLIANIIEKKIEGISIQVEASRQAPYLPKRAPKWKNIASTPRRNVSDIIAKYEMISPFKEG